MEKNECKNLGRFSLAEEFICSECKIDIINYERIITGDFEQTEYGEMREGRILSYYPKYCPECGRKIIFEREERETK